MACTITKGQTFSSTEQITNTKLHNLVDLATISGIVNAEISNSASIADTKLATITTAGTVMGTALAGLSSIPAGAGVIPATSLTSVAQKDANSDITSLTGLTTPLSTAQGGTGSTADANAASGVVVLDASSKLPAVDGTQLTGVGSALLGDWAGRDANTVYQAATDGFIVGRIRIRDSDSEDAIGVFTDGNNPPITLRTGARILSLAGVMTLPFCVPVKKNDYYKVVTGSETGFVPFAYWIPLGS